MSDMLFYLIIIYTGVVGKQTNYIEVQNDTNEFTEPTDLHHMGHRP